ncbi:MAG TPA: hypothetical protein VFD70_08600 [Anaerolineae bacterium]|nr:hypothetical protein [Anaerolineae bacterium]
MFKWSLRGLLILLFIGIVPAIVSAQSNASIKIVKPGDRRNVETAQINVTVEITGASLSDGYSWQMFVDGEPQAVVRDSLTAPIMVGEPSGPRRLKAVLYDPQGNAIASHEILVMAAPVEKDNEPVFNREWFAPLMAVFTIIIIGLLVLSLRLRPRTAT